MFTNPPSRNSPKGKKHLQPAQTFLCKRSSHRMKFPQTGNPAWDILDLIPTHAASSLRCTAEGCGRCGSTQAIPARKNPTNATASCLNKGRRGFRSLLTCQHKSATMQMTRLPWARLERWVSRFLRSKTWKPSSRTFRWIKFRQA